MHLLELKPGIVGPSNRRNRESFRASEPQKAKPSQGGTALCVFNPEVHAQVNRWKVAQEYQEKVLQTKRHGCLPKPTHQSYIYMGLRSWLATPLLLNFH